MIPNNQNYQWLNEASPQEITKFITYTEANLRRAKYRGGMVVLVPVWQSGLNKAKELLPTVDEYKLI